MQIFIYLNREINSFNKTIRKNKYLATVLYTYVSPVEVLLLLSYYFS